jgi:8-amino-7-oxononanoate synthase
VKVLSMTKLTFLRDTLQALESKHLYRSMKVIDGPQSAHVACEGRDLLMLASNSYLDLSNHPEVKAAAADAALRWGVGSGGSRLTTGNTHLHEALESTIARFKGTEAALVFDTGYMANVGTISSLCGPGDSVFSDELNHASIIDGIRLSRATVHIYRHNDMDDLDRVIRASGFVPGRGRGLVVSDAVFSMDGDILELPRFMALAEQYELLSMIDEAHATGVLGTTGRGIAEHYQSSSKPDVVMGTLSKAIGAEGGFVCGSRELVEFLKNRARSLIFSTALSPITIASALKALDIIEHQPERVLALQRNVKFFCEALSAAGIPIQSKTPIVPVVVGDEERASLLSQQLFAEGYFVSAIRYPTVAKGKARLRVALMSTHTEKELHRAARAIARNLQRSCGPELEAHRR